MSEVRSPSDLKKLALEELERYAEDLRQKILTTCMTNGGHLGASLGTVELAIALHYVFESPRDAIVWDVGHQAYAHKLITGRSDRFSTLRKYNGISGFLSREESPHDIFGAGHSSTSISAALAIAWAHQHKLGEGAFATDLPWSIAVIGDGAITAGISFEALNNVRTQPIGPFLVILNDNQMSISANVGAMPTILSGANAKDFFGLFGFDYIGPIDGHDLGSLIGTLQALRENPTGNPIVLHVFTQKGKGYTPAEEHPENFHGISPVQGKVPAGQGSISAAKPKSFSEAFGDALCRLAEKDPRIVAITAAMPEGTGLVDFSRKFPDRFFDVGIAEPHAVTFAAGLATQGFRPVVSIYSTFMQRALDEIIHDVALQKLGVVFALDRAGLVGADGPTHHGVFDLAYLRMIPGLNVHAPSTLGDLEVLLTQALSRSGPSAIRYPRGSGVAELDTPLSNGVRWHTQSDKPQVIVVCLGSTLARSANALRSKPIAHTLISTTDAKPIPSELIHYLDRHPEAELIVLEDGVILGGFGQSLYGTLQPRQKLPRLIGYADHFIPHGSPSELEERENVSAAALEKILNEIVGPAGTKRG
jgi:1-deoxy-D-xylulose-5-phosphate synthase